MHDATKLECASGTALTDLLALGGSSTMNHVQPRSLSGHRNGVFSSHTPKDNVSNFLHPVKVRKSSLIGEPSLSQGVGPAESQGGWLV